MEKIRLSRTEKKIIRALHVYSYAWIGYSELNGYLHFPPAETIYKAVDRLLARGFIREIKQPHRYVVTNEGIDALRWRLFEGVTLGNLVTAAVTAAITATVTVLVTQYIQ